MQMKALFFHCCFSAFPSALFHRKYRGSIIPLKFNKRYTQCERKWVVFPKKDVEESYSYGMIYLDARAGFTFGVKGNFKIDRDGRYIADTSFLANTSMKVRLMRNSAHAALVPPAHFTELHIKPQPDRIKGYYRYTDTLAHNFHWGFIYVTTWINAIPHWFILIRFMPYSHITRGLGLS